MLEQFTQRGRQVIESSQDEARTLHAQHVGAEHLLLAVLRVDDGKLGRDVLGVSAAQVREALITDASAASIELAEHIPFAPNAKRVMNAAVQETHSFGGHVDASHLLAHILASGDEVIDRVLAALNVDREYAYQRAKDLSSAQHGGSAAEASQLPNTTEELIHRNEALVAALRRYGRHENDCTAPRAPCICGLSRALLETEGDQ